MNASQRLKEYTYYNPKDRKWMQIKDYKHKQTKEIDGNLPGWYTNPFPTVCQPHRGVITVYDWYILVCYCRSWKIFPISGPPSTCTWKTDRMIEHKQKNNSDIHAKHIVILQIICAMYDTGRMKRTTVMIMKKSKSFYFLTPHQVQENGHTGDGQQRPCNAEKWLDKRKEIRWADIPKWLIKGVVANRSNFVGLAFFPFISCLSFPSISFVCLCL